MKFLLLIGVEGDLRLTAGFLLALVVCSAAIFWLWKRPPRTPALLAAVYLLTASAVSVVAIALVNDYLLMMSSILSFPWIFLLILLDAFLEVGFGESIVFPGLVINAFLIYQIGKAARNRNEDHL